VYRYAVRTVLYREEAHPFFVQVAFYILAWVQSRYKKRRRLVVFASREKTKVEEDHQMDTVEEFFVYSWNLEEYLSAVEHDDFSTTSIGVYNRFKYRPTAFRNKSQTSFMY